MEIHSQVVLSAKNKWTKNRPEGSRREQQKKNSRSPISMEKQKLQHVGQSHSLRTLRTLRPREPQRFPLRGLFGLRRAAGPSGARPGASARFTTIEYHRIYPQCLYKYYLYIYIYIVCNYSYSTH